MSAGTEISSPRHGAGRMTPAEVRALPAFVPLADVGRALGLGRSTVFAQARDEKSFPIPILRVGRTRGCTLTDLCAHLKVQLTP